VTVKGESIEMMLMGALGFQHIYPLLGATAIGINEGLPLTKIKEHLLAHQSPPGRMHLLQGINGSCIIDDTYNASPVAVGQAITTMAELEVGQGKKIIALGDMLELGSYSSKEHVQVGEMVAKVADILATVGVRSRSIAEGAKKAGMPESSIVQFDDSTKAGEYLKSIVSKGDIVLVKGSQSIRMERAVEAIMAYPEDKESLLVRQDPMWLRK
jgi:UDP-N-acetylmuramoyl-tripeptide--D-alanyl-D-alanine ligase